VSEQSTLAGQRQPTGPGSAGEAGDQLLVDRVQTVRASRLVPEFIQVHSLLLGHHVSHQVLPP
jgi:hypothetical protein